MIQPHKSDVKLYLKTKTKAELVDMITKFYDLSEGKCTWLLFDDLIFETQKRDLDASWLNIEIDKFIRESKSGKYYDPQYDQHIFFISESTEDWIDTLVCMVDLCCVLIERGEKVISSLRKLDDLLEYALTKGTIVFESELGDWMIKPRFDYKKYLT
jgi:hypothetical protein